MSKPYLLVPLAGFGSRFRDVGFKLPKQQLVLANGITCLEESLSSIATEDFKTIFVLRQEQVDAEGFDPYLASIMAGSEYEIVTLEKPTGGSLESCLAASSLVPPGSNLSIFTADVSFSPKFRANQFDESFDGGVLTFKSNSPNYSYARVSGDKVVATEEKVVIGPDALVGIYYFKNSSKFFEAASKVVQNGETSSGEFYIAPLYNPLIADGAIIAHDPVEKMHLFGTPSEFAFFNSVTARSQLSAPRIGLFSDHSGFRTKELMVEILKSKGLAFEDFGTFSTRDTDYNSFAESGARALDRGEVDYLFGFCSSGQGVNLAAQSYPWILGALVFDEDSAEYAVRHNGANFFSFPERVWLSDASGLEACIDKVVSNSFDGGRHQGRVMSVLEARGAKNAIP